MSPYPSTLAPASRRIKYEIEHTHGCVVIRGAVPADAFMILAKLAPEGSVACMDLPKRMGASFVFGLREDLDRLQEELPQLVLPAFVEKALSEQAINWLIEGERGLSSETIFTRVTGYDALNGDFDGAMPPSDVSDLRRCRQLLEQCPEINSKFKEVMAAEPGWELLVQEWDSLCCLMDKEVPNWRQPVKGESSIATETYKKMKDLERALREPKSHAHPKA